MSGIGLSGGDAVRDVVRQKYGAAALRVLNNDKQATGGCCGAISSSESCCGGDPITGRLYAEADAVAIPDVVELYLPAKEEMHQIRVQWRKGDEMGIDFIRPEESAEAGAVATPTDLSGRVLKLESECAALKRTLGDLRAEIRKLRGDVV